MKEHMKGGSNGNDHSRSVYSDHLPLVLSFIVYLVLLLSMATFGRGYLNFRVVYGLWFVSYLMLMYSLHGSSIIEKIEKMDPIKLYFLIFLFALVLHIPFLLGEPMMSQDIFRLERRGELLLDGKFPYQDFNVNKPPLYIWLVGLVSLPFGPDQLSFRIAFSIANSFVPVMMILIHKNSGNLNLKGKIGSRLPALTWFGGAVAYALCPVVILETGIAGHFDPVVVIATLVSFYFLVKNRAFLSGLMLGTGFALKLYPMFLAPVFFLALKGWKNRILMFTGFFIVPVISSIPIMIRDPTLLVEYLQYQFGDWYAGFSIKSVIDSFLSSISIDPSYSGSLMTLLLLSGIAIILIRGLLGRIDRRDTMVEMLLLIILSILGVSVSSAIIFGGRADPFWIMFSIFSLLISISFQVYSLHLFLQWKKGTGSFFKDISIKKIFTSAIDIGNVPLIGSLILVLLITTSSQFHPWYIAWVLPFSFTCGNPRWTWPVLLLLGSVQMNYYPPWELGGF